MSTYLISYDLKRVKNYPRLYECLVQWKAQRLLESLWAAQLKGPCPAIRDILMHHVDGDDALVVVEVVPGADWATVRARHNGVRLLSVATPSAA